MVHFLILKAHINHDLSNDMGLNVLRELLLYHGHNTINRFDESVLLDEPLDKLLDLFFLEPSLLLLLKKGLNHEPSLSDLLHDSRYP